MDAESIREERGGSMSNATRGLVLQVERRADAAQSALRHDPDAATQGVSLSRKNSQERAIYGSPTVDESSMRTDWDPFQGLVPRSVRGTIVSRY